MRRFGMSVRRKIAALVPKLVFMYTSKIKVFIESIDLILDL
jgi:hypothetical protein